MKKDNKINITNSIKIIVTPWERGFTCGILMNKSAKMTPEQYELCSTVARGMIKFATDEPNDAFTLGIKGFADDRKNSSPSKNIECIAECTHDPEEATDVIDFIEALKKRRDKKLS